MVARWHAQGTTGGDLRCVHDWFQEHEDHDGCSFQPARCPTPRGVDYVALAADVGPTSAWDAGEDGRLLLHPLRASAPDLVTSGGNLLLVNSEFAGVDRSLEVLRASGLSTVVVWQSIPFGPVLLARATWMERAVTNCREAGRRASRRGAGRRGPAAPLIREVSRAFVARQFRLMFCSTRADSRFSMALTAPARSLLFCS